MSGRNGERGEEYKRQGKAEEDDRHRADRAGTTHNEKGKEGVAEGRREGEGRR